MNLKLKEIKILQQLLVDGRQTISAIAKKTRLSNEIVDYTIKKFLRDGLIKNFGVLVDESRLGYSLVQVLLNLDIPTKEEEDRVIKLLEEHPLIVWAVKCGGRYNFAIELYAKDIVSLDSLIAELSVKIGKNLINYETFLVAYQYKFTYGIGELIRNLKDIGETKEIKYHLETVKIGLLDRKLLALLENNGRAQLTELAGKLKISPDAVNYRMKKLKEKGILLGIVPHIDLLKLGYQKYIVIVDLKNVEMTKNPMKGYIQQQPYIRYCVRHTGKMQLYFLMFAESTEHFHTMLDEMQFANKDIIDSVQFYPVFRKYKESLFPEGLQN